MTEFGGADCRMTLKCVVAFIAVCIVSLVCMANLRAQNGEPLTLEVSGLPAEMRLDGLLDEPEWAAADSIDGLTMFEPTEGNPLSGRTVVRVLADAGDLVIGVICEHAAGSGIVSFSKARDSELRNEDHIKFILDTFMDGRSGYIFAVNPAGSRYDALVDRNGEGESPEWDTAWEAATSRGPNGWSAEIRIPIQSLSFRKGLTEWGFNIERRLEEVQETGRWSSPTRDAKISQSSRAGRITNLPEFNFGIGLTIRPGLVGQVEGPDTDIDRVDDVLEPSLDVTQRIGPNVIVSGTANTDFGETEVDTRRTNLTRFSLFFPEKRTFFLEGADIFNFGIGLRATHSTDLVPFFSRRIGLFEDEEVPLQAGGKINGRVGNTNFGALAVRTGEVDGLVPASTMGVVRVKQNVLEQSSAGMLATFGDPQGRSGSWMAGTDFTYQTSKLWGDKNFLAGVWGLVSNRDGLEGDKTAFGAKLDYPNDTWDIALIYTRIGDAFDPSLGFVPRASVQLWKAGVSFRYRPSWPWLRQMFYEFLPDLALDLDGNWESYRVFTAPINWRFESGDRFEFNVVPEGEQLVEPFAITDSVVIPAGAYHWVRYRFEQDFAARRMVSGRISWWFGGFYGGHLHQLTTRVELKPSAFASFELSAERNVGDLPAGDFTQDLFGGRLRVNFSPDLQVNSFVQYDNESREFGANTRLRWTFDPLGDLFVVYNHNLVDLTDRWALDSNQLLVKVQYAWRM
jgi:hypothetical protein